MLAKVDVDQNQRIAAQLRIQSIPTVYAFWQGQPVDGFQGAVPGSEIKAFIERVSALAGDGGLADALEAAEAMLAEGAVVDAAETFAAILGEDPANGAAYGGLIRSHLALGEIDQAQALADAASPEVTKAKEVEAARAQIELARQAANAGPETELRAAVAADENDHQARFDLALALHAERQGGRGGGSVARSVPARPRVERRGSQGAAHDDLRGAEADRPRRPEGTPSPVVDDICLTGRAA